MYAFFLGSCNRPSSSATGYEESIKTTISKKGKRSRQVQGIRNPTRRLTHKGAVDDKPGSREPTKEWWCVGTQITLNAQEEVVTEGKARVQVRELGSYNRRGFLSRAGKLYQFTRRLHQATTKRMLRSVKVKTQSNQT